MNRERKGESCWIGGRGFSCGKAAPANGLVDWGRGRASDLVKSLEAGLLYDELLYDPDT